MKMSSAAHSYSLVTNSKNTVFYKRGREGRFRTEQQVEYSSFMLFKEV